MKTTTLLIAFSAVALILSVGSTSHADILSPVADAYVQGTNGANSNFGAADPLWLKYDRDGGSYNRKVYMRFDLSSLGFDHTTQTAGASLKLQFVDTAVGTGGTTIDWEFEVFGLNDNDPGENWGETAVTWNNAPANDKAAGNGALGNASSLGTFAFVGRTASVDFSGAGGTAVKNFISQSDDDDLVTFIIVRNTPQPAGSNTYVHGVASRDNVSFPPELTVTPEPSTFALIAFGLLGLRRRRRSGS